MLLQLQMDGHNFDFVAVVEHAAVDIAVRMAADIDDYIAVRRHNLHSHSVVDNIDLDDEIHCFDSYHYDYL